MQLSSECAHYLIRKVLLSRLKERGFERENGKTKFHDKSDKKMDKPIKTRIL